jgi:enoyl-CoA hydratase/carnithine racemase
MRGFIDIRVDGVVATIALNRPDKANAMHRPLWNELRDAMRWLDETPTIRVGVLTGAGRHFTAGIDLALLDELRQGVESGCAGRSRE